MTQSKKSNMHQVFIRDVDVTAITLDDFYFDQIFTLGVISGALLYIRDDFDQVDKKTWLQVSLFCFLQFGVSGVGVLMFL